MLSEKMFARAERMRSRGHRAYAMFLRKDANEVALLEAEHAALKREYGLLEVTYEEVLKDKGQLLDENAVLIKRLWDYEHQASDERIRDEK